MQAKEYSIDKEKLPMTIYHKHLRTTLRGRNIKLIVN